VSRIRGVVGAVVLCFGLAACSISSTNADLALCDPTGAGYHLLAAQAVPSATLLPCVREYPAGWRYAGSEVGTGIARFWLDSDRAGIHAVEVSMTASCSVAGMNEVTRFSGELGVDVYIHRIGATPYAADRHFVFAGGCVTYRYRFGTTDRAVALAAEADEALTFVDRSVLVAVVEDALGLTLCGAEAPPCVGED
jgi:hypothetical protein